MIDRIPYMLLWYIIYHQNIFVFPFEHKYRIFQEIFTIQQIWCSDVVGRPSCGYCPHTLCLVVTREREEKRKEGKSKEGRQGGVNSDAFHGPHNFISAQFGPKQQERIEISGSTTLKASIFQIPFPMQTKQIKDRIFTLFSIIYFLCPNTSKRNISLSLFLSLPFLQLQPNIVYGGNIHRKVFQPHLNPIFAKQ